MEYSRPCKRARDADEIGNQILKTNLQTLEAGERKKDNDEDENLEDTRTRKTEEYNFLRLFTTILNSILVLKCPNEIFICQSIVSIRKSFKFGSGPFSFSAIDFTKWENICGYLYRYGSHGAGFARFRILYAAKNCKVVEEILKKPDLKVICLGTGPGNDAVGLCSVLSEWQTPKSLELTVVDKFKEWSLSNKLLKVFIEEDNFGKVSELFKNINVEFRFIQTDLPGNVKSDKMYFEMLAVADVIVMSKLVSILDKSNNKELERRIIKSLYKEMKEDAVIFLNDSFNKDMWCSFHLIYSWGKEKKDEYMSSALAKRKFNQDDAVSSNLPINVLVKKESPEIFSSFGEQCDDLQFP